MTGPRVIFQFLISSTLSFPLFLPSSLAHRVRGWALPMVNLMLAKIIPFIALARKSYANGYYDRVSSARRENRSDDRRRRSTTRTISANLAKRGLSPGQRTHTHVLGPLLFIDDEDDRDDARTRWKNRAIFSLTCCTSQSDN